MKRYPIFVFIVAGLLLCIAPANAHSVLMDSTPHAGQTLNVLPEEFSVTMNERLLTEAGLAAFTLRVRDADGRYYGDGCLQVFDDTVSTEATIGDAGDYLLEWQVVSADSHPVGGEIPFIWTGAANATGSDTPPQCGNTNPAETNASGSALAPDATGHQHGSAGAVSNTIPIEDVLWVIVAGLAVALAVTVTLLFTRRNPQK